MDIATTKEYATKWMQLCDLINAGKLYVVFLDRVDSIHTGLEVYDSGDLTDELAVAVEAAELE